MRYTFRRLLVLLPMLAAFTLVGADTKPKQAVAWEPWMETGREVFPSLLIATATVDWREENETAAQEKEAGEEAEEATSSKKKGVTERSQDKKAPDKKGKPVEPDEEEAEEYETLGDYNSWYGAKLRDVPKGTRIKVEVSGDGWMKPSAIEVTTERAMPVVYVQPKVIYDYEVLRQCLAQRPVNLKFKVSLNGSEGEERVETVTMHDLHDCPFLIEESDEEEATDLSWMFAAYVNEKHPEIDPVLKEALRTGLVDSFDGYQSEDRDQVIAQVFAIWHVLQRTGIRYSDISNYSGFGRVASQSVRFLDESIHLTQANCVDGSVLMASILQKIGINAYLVIVPGHCFLAFDADEEGEDVVGLETTMLGDDKLSPIKDAATLPEKARQKEFASSRKTFRHALKDGTDDLNKHWKKFDAGDDPDYQLVSILAAREMGIMPIVPAKPAK